MAFIRLIVASILIEKGTPIAQLIPFRRAHAALDDVVRAETVADRDAKNRILRSTMAGDGWYRKEREPRAEAVPEGPSGGRSGSTGPAPATVVPSSTTAPHSQAAAAAPFENGLRRL